MATESGSPDWSSMPFAEAVEINPRRPLPASGDVPFLDMASLPSNGAPVVVSESRTAAAGGARFRVGDTLFARITPCAENGKLGFVEDIRGGDTALGSTEFIVMAARHRVTLPEYVCHLAGWDRVRQQAISLMEGTSGRQRVPSWAFDEIEIALPPLEEQQRITAVLRAVDEAIYASQDALSAAKLVRQATLNALMLKEVEQASEELVALSRVAEVRIGIAKNGSRGGANVSVPYLRVANVQDGWFDLAEVKEIAVSPDAIRRYSLKPGDVLLTEGGDFDKLGRGGVWSGEIDPCLHQNHVFAVRPDTAHLSPDYLALVAQSFVGRAYFLSCAKRTTNLASINSTQLKGFPLPLPSLHRQAAIVHQVDSIQEIIAAEQTGLATLRRLRSSLSDALLSGRVRVPNPAFASTSERSVMSEPRAVQPAFKRAVFAAEVVHQLHADPRFGSVKHEKIVHLCELHVGLHGDLDRHAYKEAAGPYDPRARRSVEGILRKQQWFDAIKEDGKRVAYRPLARSGGHAPFFERYFGDRRADIQTIIDLIRPMTTQQAEIVATLYSVWNDLLIDGAKPADAEIVASVLTDWHPSKAQIAEAKWFAALPWMRQQGLVPRGLGEKTRVSPT